MRRKTGAPTTTTSYRSRGSEAEEAVGGAAEADPPRRSMVPSRVRQRERIVHRDVRPRARRQPRARQQAVVREEWIVDEVVLEDERRVDEQEPGHRATA